MAVRTTDAIAGYRAPGRGRNAVRALRFYGEGAAKRALVCGYDLACALVCAFMASFAWTPCAYAYIDPSIMTYTIQAVAGVVVALSTVFGVFARRTRKKLMRILDLDEDSKREREPKVHRVDADGNVIAHASAAVAAPAGASAADASAPAPSPKRRGRKGKAGKVRAPYAPAWRTRFVYALLACGFTIFTVFVMAPFEVVGGSAGSLVFSLGDVWYILAVPAALAIVASALLLSALRKRLYLFFLVLVSAVGLAAYVQALLLNGGLPAADGGTIVWADHADMITVSAVVWIAVIVIPLVASFFNRRRAQGVVGIVCACLIVIQGVGLASLFIAPPAASGSGGMDDLTHTNVASQTETAMTEDGLYTVSPKSNVVVFVLDTFDTTELERLLKVNPGLLNEMTGFTNFENCTGSMIPTRFAVPYLMTGSLPQVGEDIDTYLAERYARSSFIGDAYDAGYSIGLYTDSLQIGSLPEAEQHAITDKTVNMHRLSSSAIDYAGTLKALVQIGLYRDVPWAFKYVFWYYTDQINGAIVRYDPDADPGERVYTMNDLRFYQQLKSRGLAATDNGEAGAFRFVHLLGAHYPFSYDEYANDLGTDNSTQDKQAQGSLYIVSEYLRQLKQLGVYDNTTVIITADHGRWFLTTGPLERTSTPIMLVKPATSGNLEAHAQQAGTANGEDAAAVVSDMPVSHHDYLPTVAEAMGLDPAAYASGTSLFDVTDPARVRTYLTTDSEGLRGIGLREYAIDGDALDFANWRETGNYWELHE